MAKGVNVSMTAPRLLINGAWFEALASTALLEREFENLLEASKHDLFPGFRFVPFKTDVPSEFGTNRADFALIDANYRAWWVVEVELAHHSLAGHVLPQVAGLAAGLYGEEHVVRLCEADSLLDATSVRQMLLGSQPSVLVLVNDERSAWLPELRALGCRLVVVRIFRSNLNQTAMVVSGEVPEPSLDLITRCKAQRTLPSFLEVQSPAGLRIRHGETVQVAFGSGVLEWMRLDIADAVYLVPKAGSGGLPADLREVDLSEAEDGRLIFRQPSRRSRP